MHLGEQFQALTTAEWSIASESEFQEWVKDFRKTTRLSLDSEDAIYEVQQILKPASSSVRKCKTLS